MLLNHLVCRSKTRAPGQFSPPTHGASEMFDLLAQRHAKGWTVEFLKGDEDADDAARISKNTGRSFIRLSGLELEEREGHTYTTLLVEFGDSNVTSFPVIHTSTFKGREIAGEDDERGCAAAHVVVRAPNQGRPDVGRYRCAIEAVPTVSRRSIEFLLCRQLRRVSDGGGWTFPATVAERRRSPVTKEYRYTPRMELHADVGRKLGEAWMGENELSHMVFTKRSERQSIGKETEVLHEDFTADVEMRVSAKQGPADRLAKLKWASGVRELYEKRGFATRLFYRNLSGDVTSGDVHPTVDGAADLLMCRRELIRMPRPVRNWESKINPDVKSALIEVLDKDDLWQRPKPG